MFKFLTLLLEKRVGRARRYRAARARQLRWLEVGRELGSNGQIAWQREQLHER